MFHDIQNQLSSKQALAGVTATVSTDVYDTGKVGGSDISIGGKTGISVLVVPTTVTVATGGIKIEFIQSASDTMSSPDVLATRDIAAADLKVDSRLELPIPQGSISKRFVAIRYTGGNAALAANVSGYIVPTAEIPVWTPFPKVYNTI